MQRQLSSDICVFLTVLAVNTPKLRVVRGSAEYREHTTL